MVRNENESHEYIAKREDMVARQIERRGLREPRLLDAFRTIPRHLFVPTRYISDAYDDCPLPIGSGQTISQPYIVALMTSLLQLEGSEKVLEIGTGSGYQAAILAALSGTVHTVERYEKLASQAKEVLLSLDLMNVDVHIGDGSKGWPSEAPYDAIMVTAAAPNAPMPLLEQLNQGGRLVIPVGPRYNQMLQVWRREANGFSEENMVPVSFVPLRGEYGWSESDW